MDKNFKFKIKADVIVNKKLNYYSLWKFIKIYNRTMEFILNTFLYSFVLDYLINLSQKKLFKLQVKNICVLLLQVFNVACVAIFLFCDIEIYLFLILKIAANLIISLLITNYYNAKEIALLFGFYLIFLFSVYGFAIFFTEFTRVVILKLFGYYVEKIYNYLLLFGNLMFIFIIVFFAQNIGKNKTINSFLMKVSFLLFGKHIEITGLLDSGNVLYDTKTGKAVVVVSAAIFRQVLPKKDYIKFLKHDYSSVKVSNEISCVVVGGTKLTMPVFDVGLVSVSNGEKTITKDCVLGVVNQEFVQGKYQCLIHRDFV